MRSRKYDKKLSMILDRACGIFAEKGYHNASVRDLAAATGTSPAGLYYYFRSKEELLHLILSSCLSSLLDRVKKAAAGLKDPGKRLKAIVRIHLDHFRQNSKEMQVLVREWKALSGPFGEELRKLMREYTGIVSETFRELHPQRSPEELRAATFGLFGMLTWVDQWYRPGRDLPLDLLADQFSVIFLGGFVPTTPNGATAAAANGERTPREWSRQDSTSSILSGPGF